jgi:hypothetical protein
VSTAAQATHTSDGARATDIADTAGALLMAQAMAASPASVLSATLESDGTGDTHHAAVMSYASPMAQFPSSGSSFMMIGSGETNLANDTSIRSQTSTSTFLQSSGITGSPTDVMNTNEGFGNDLSGLTAMFSIPDGSGIPCFTVDLKFLSEEFPEYVGSAFNDFVTGRINNDNAPTVDVSVPTAPKPVAPGNFIRDANGNPVTVNNNYAASPANSSGTMYDQATPTLRAKTPVPEGDSFEFTVYVADAGDNAYDTMVFLDNARVQRVAKCPTGAIGGGTLKLNGRVRKGKVVASGSLAPPHPTKNVKVTLYKRKGGAWRKVDSKRARLGAAVDTNKDGSLDASRYRTTFPAPARTQKCKLKATFVGDKDTLPVSRSDTFNC